MIQATIITSIPYNNVCCIVHTHIIHLSLPKKKKKNPKKAIMC